jgi:hypothetical protein
LTDSTESILQRIDTLLMAAQNTSDQAEKDAAVREATRLLRMVRERIEVARMPADLRYLAAQFERLIQ